MTTLLFSVRQRNTVSLFLIFALFKIPLDSSIVHVCRAIHHGPILESPGRQSGCLLSVLGPDQRRANRWVCCFIGTVLGVTPNGGGSGVGSDDTQIPSRRGSGWSLLLSSIHDSSEARPWLGWKKSCKEAQRENTLHTVIYFFTEGLGSQDLKFCERRARLDTFQGRCHTCGVSWFLSD